jgi:pyruvate kinase
MLETGSFVTLAGHGDAQGGDLELGFEIDFALHLRRGHDVLINDGLVRLRVVEARERRVRCSVEIGGRVRPTRASTCPARYLPIPSHHAATATTSSSRWQTGRLRGALVRARAEDVEDLKSSSRPAGSRARVIAKIEKARRSSTSTRSSP